ncbi:hypothetical protein HU200_024855 [Digitaria exilis]|uniref:Photosystem II reaction center protein Z n=1 Tax=Digitaria exilis TaxID=1010633 RepID=A0A835EY93_9POAL|nr:hypothetical protein HU200_024855 [Digitaria exilis]
MGASACTSIMGVPTIEKILDRIRMAARSTSMAMEDDYETEQKKQAAADVLFHYSQFVMVCIGEDVRPTDLRLHLMKNFKNCNIRIRDWLTLEFGVKNRQSPYSAFQLAIFPLIATSSIVVIGVPHVFASPDGWSNNKTLLGQRVFDMKVAEPEVSGMPTSLKEPQQAAASPESSGEPSSSGTMKTEIS